MGCAAGGPDLQDALGIGYEAEGLGHLKPWCRFYTIFLQMT